jgi:hypothetical protein
MKPTTKPTDAERANALDAFARRGAAGSAPDLATARQAKAIAASVEMLSGPGGEECRALAETSLSRIAEYNAANREAAKNRGAK